jgi:hypothetical protein
MNLERGGGTRIRRRKAKLTERSLVELVAAPPSIAAVGGGRYTLEVGGVRVEFGDDASVATLRRVLEALRSC